MLVNQAVTMAAHALLTWPSYHTTRLVKTQPGPPSDPLAIRVHDFVRTSNGRPRSEACVFARPQPRELAVCVPLPTRAAKPNTRTRTLATSYPPLSNSIVTVHAAPAPLLSLLCQFCPGTFPLSVLTCHITPD